jgi:hypothetical protein
MEMFHSRLRVLVVGATLSCCGAVGFAQAPDNTQLLGDLMRRLEADEARIKELEQKLAATAGGSTTSPIAASASPVVANVTAPSPAAQTPGTLPDAQVTGHEMQMTLPGGPQLKIRVFPTSISGSARWLIR